jgi:hypothetical protein
LHRRSGHETEPQWSQDPIGITESRFLRKLGSREGNNVLNDHTGGGSFVAPSVTGVYASVSKQLLSGVYKGTNGAKATFTAGGEHACMSV